MSELEIHAIPKDLYYREVDYVRGLEAKVRLRDEALRGGHNGFQLFGDIAVGGARRAGSQICRE